MIKHVNTKHNKSLKCKHCSDIIKDNEAMAAHIIKVHSIKQNASEDGTKTVDCDKFNSKFTSKMALSQHMFTTHTPTRIEETGIYCNLCGEEFWTELDMINHLKAHINGSKTDEPFFCKLCGIGLSEKNAINQHMINHVENVLQEGREAKENSNKVVKKLATITENEDETKSESEPDEEEEVDFENFFQIEIVEGETVFACNICNEGFDHIKEIRKHLQSDHEEVIEYVSINKENGKEKDKEEESYDDYDYYEGFDEDGNRIIEEEEYEN